MRKYIENINCIREGDHFAISWDNGKREVVRIYYNTVPEADGNEIMLVSSNSGSVRIEDPLKERRIYFILKSDGYEDSITAEKVLPLEGACNFRDLGGYVTEDGRRVKWNCFYRAATLGHLTGTDLSYLASLGLKESIDYRSEAEAKSDPDVGIKGICYCNIPALPMADKADASFSAEGLFSRASKMGATAPDALMIEGYKGMIFNNPAYREMFRLVQMPDGTPFVQHCQSGKDRTGLGAAFLLLALGVPMETVKEDYMLSRVFIRPCRERLERKYKDELDTPEKLRLFDALLNVQEKYLDSAFAEIFKRYGSLSEYFKQEYGLGKEDIEKLRERYLY